MVAGSSCWLCRTSTEKWSCRSLDEPWAGLSVSRASCQNLGRLLAGCLRLSGGKQCQLRAEASVHRAGCGVPSLSSSALAASSSSSRSSWRWVAARAHNVTIADNFARSEMRLRLRRDAPSSSSSVSSLSSRCSSLSSASSICGTRAVRPSNQNLTANSRENSARCELSTCRSRQSRARIAARLDTGCMSAETYQSGAVDASKCSATQPARAGGSQRARSERAAREQRAASER